MRGAGELASDSFGTSGISGLREDLVKEVDEQPMKTSTSTMYTITIDVDPLTVGIDASEDTHTEYASEDLYLQRKRKNSQIEGMDNGDEERKKKERVFDLAFRLRLSHDLSVEESLSEETQLSGLYRHTCLYELQPTSSTRIMKK